MTIGVRMRRLTGQAADGGHVELVGAHPFSREHPSRFLGTSVRVLGAGPGVRGPVAVTMRARPAAVTRRPR